MNIDKNTVVSFHYRVFDTDDSELESSHDHDPMTYLHGHKGIITGLEKAMAGRQAGDSYSVTLEPKDAYGSRREDATQRLQKKSVATKGKLTPGMTITVNSDRGPRQVRLIKAGKFVVDVDTNHPLAGLILRFEVEIVDVREASAEEIAHRHVHGPHPHH